MHISMGNSTTFEYIHNCFSAVGTLNYPKHNLNISLYMNIL